MEVKNCKGCGRIFNYMEGPQLCDNCKKKLEEKFQQVKKYIRDHPAASVNEVADENEVSAKQIKAWIRQERLMLSEASCDGITCEHCGRPIRTGRFCDKCKAAMKTSFAYAVAKPQPKDSTKPHHNGDKMRFL